MANLGFGGIPNNGMQIAPTAADQDAEYQAMQARVADMRSKMKDLGLNAVATNGYNAVGNTGMGFDQLYNTYGPNGSNPVQPQSNLGMGNPYVQPAPSAAAPSTPNTSGSSYQQNPYLNQMAQGITQQMNDNWSRNIAPSIRSGAMAAGGFGGSRQGVVESNALNDMNRSLGQNLTNLYGTDWTNSQNRGLQQQQINNQNDQFYSNLDSNNAQFGSRLGLDTLDAQNRWATNGVDAATKMYQTPINYFNGFNQNANQIAGQGGTASQTNQGNPYIGALGGLQLASSFYK